MTRDRGDGDRRAARCGNQRVPRLAACSLAAGIAATLGANLAPGLGHGAIGALVSAWPAVALAGSFELLMLLIRSAHQVSAQRSAGRAGGGPTWQPY